MTKRQLAIDIRLYFYFFLRPLRLLRLIHAARATEAVLSGPRVTPRILRESRGSLEMALGKAVHENREIFWLLSY